MEELDNLKKFERSMAMAKAVRESMVEVMNERRSEIIGRAVAKLKEQGIEVSVKEIGVQLGDSQL